MTSMAYRLPAISSDQPHVQRYRDAVAVSKTINDKNGYYAFARIHGEPEWKCWHHQFQRGSDVRHRMFLPWHRAYLYHYEQSLKDIDEAVTLPYWDYFRDPSIPNAFSDPTVDGQPNSLFAAHIKIDRPATDTPIDRPTRRAPPVPPPWDLPIQIFSNSLWSARAAQVDSNGNNRLSPREMIAYMTEIEDFRVFNDLLESLHDFIHALVGGDMGDPSYSAFDPIFYSHHCMIDKVWASWQKKHGIDNIPPSVKQANIPAFGLTVEQVLDTEELGYAYADSAINIPLD